jgi:hypothetical protein
MTKGRHTISKRRKKLEKIRVPAERTDKSVWRTLRGCFLVGAPESERMISWREPRAIDQAGGVS